MKKTSDCTPRLISYLATLPTLNRLAQFLALDLFTDHDPHSTLIHGFDSDGQCHVLGSFGLPHEVVKELQHLSIWDGSPAVDAIRQGDSHLFLDAVTVQWRYPMLARHPELLHPTMAWPLMRGVERVGAIHLQFNLPPNEQALTALLTEVAPLVSLYLGLTGEIRQPNNDQRNNRERARRSNDAELTERQLTIMRLLAQGLTNPQIAARIAFSDSTVRQETMVIYRYLGASGRREAARIAGQRGLLLEQGPRAETLTICN
jgi:DNA-binding CsgD family transcriptional regulator